MNNTSPPDTAPVKEPAPALILTDLVQDRPLKRGEELTATIIARCGRTKKPERFARRLVVDPPGSAARVRIVSPLGGNQYAVEIITPATDKTPGPADRR